MFVLASHRTLKQTRLCHRNSGVGDHFPGDVRDMFLTTAEMVNKEVMWRSGYRVAFTLLAAPFTLSFRGSPGGGGHSNAAKVTSSNLVMIIRLLFAFLEWFWRDTRRREELGGFIHRPSSYQSYCYSSS